MDVIHEDPTVGNRVDGRNVFGNWAKGTIQSIDDSKSNKIYTIKWDDNSQTEVSWSKQEIISEKEKHLFDDDGDGIDADIDDEMQGQKEKPD